MFAKRSEEQIDNIYKAITIIVIFVLLFSAKTVFSVYASGTAENFYDYVREERRKEVVGVEKSEERLLDKFRKERQDALIIGRLSAFSLSILWVAIVYRTGRKVYAPYSEKVEYETEALLVNISPVEISAILNREEISKYDLIATLFDLIERDFLKIFECERELRLYVNEDLPMNTAKELECYEDFLIGWFIKKIGGGEYFSFRRLWDFLSSSSRAVEFDIDYDIWVDEVEEFIKEKQIYEEKIENLKQFFIVLGAMYAFFGLALLYLTGTSTAILLFGITFLSIRLPFFEPRRTRQSEEKYHSLMGLKAKILTDIAVTADLNDSKKWDKYFIFSIPMGTAELLTEEHSKYRRHYPDFVENIEKAIIHTNNTVHSLFNN